MAGHDTVGDADLAQLALVDVGEGLKEGSMTGDEGGDTTVPSRREYADPVLRNRALLKVRPTCNLPANIMRI